MKSLPMVLLRDRDAFWRRLQAHDLRWRELLGLIAFVALACALYGAVLAGWRSPQLAGYVACKLPLLFLGTTLLVAVFNWMTAAGLGSGLSFKSTVFTVVAAMTIGGWILLALVPVALFFLATGVPYAGTPAELRYAHNSILMTHVALLALAGILGNAALLQGLRRIVPPRCPDAFDRNFYEFVFTEVLPFLLTGGS